MAVSFGVVATAVMALLSFNVAVLASGDDEVTLHVKVTTLPDDVTQMEATDGVRYLLAVHETSSGDVNCYTDRRTRAALSGATPDVKEDAATSQLVQSVVDDPQALSVTLGPDQEKDMFLMCEDDPEDLLAVLAQLTNSPAPTPQRKKRLARRRAKRSAEWLIYPGTKWCGAGHVAANDSDLGKFEETDKCCRTHDHCETYIQSWRYWYGMFNWYFWTVNHCDCDDAFKECLTNVKGKKDKAAAQTVKSIFYNILGIRCFTLDSWNIASYRD